jgi:uncharacterized cupredoxin-like copper-binding protein
MRVSLGAVLVVALIGVAGCGGDDNGDGGTTAATTTTGTSTTQAAETINVSLSDFKIDPPNPRIAKAGQVAFRVKNDGGTVHSLEVEGPNGEAKLPSDLNPGQTGALTVDLSKPGKYEWYCPIGKHREFGMEGEITVAGGGGATTTGTNTTETDTTETDTTDNSGSGGYGN